MSGVRDAPVVEVALVEDDVTFQDAFRTAMEAAPDMRLTAMATNKTQALALLDASAPNVLVVDLGLPDGSGIEVIRAAHARWPDCAITVSSTFTDEGLVLDSIEAGASGYLLKDGTSGKLADEVRTLHDGGSPISPLIARQILARLRPGGSTAAASAPQPESASLLSVREQEVLKLVAKGYTYDEIAKRLQITRNTVMTFIRRIYAKLGVKSKVDSINKARKLGLLKT